MFISILNILKMFKVDYLGLYTRMQFYGSCIETFQLMRLRFEI